MEKEEYDDHRIGDRTLLLVSGAKMKKATPEWCTEQKTDENVCVGCMRKERIRKYKNH